MAIDRKPLLEINDLRISFHLDEGVVRAVDGVSLAIDRGAVLGVVGESGCGKSVTAQSILRILPRTARIEAGQILLHRSRESTNGEGAEVVDVARLSPTGRQIRGIRGKDVGMVFQEPMSSFSPLHTIGDQIMEPMMLHLKLPKAKARKLAIESLARVGISEPKLRVDQYPHELSGGMRQRAMIALALGCNPSLLIADEPTTALDVTVQGQILELMRNLQREMGLAIMFITHNLGVVAQMADEVVIMYLGRVVEQGPVRAIFHEAKHPYTQDLLRAIPRIGMAPGQRLKAIEGSIPSPFERLRGCVFHPRCSQCVAGRCDVEVPVLTQMGDGHSVRCFLY